MRRGTFVHVLLLGLLLILPPLAHASPTDPTWIPGFYDDNDYDDVILFIIGAVGAVESRVLAPIGPIDIGLRPITPSRGRSGPSCPLESPSTRAPPSRLS